MSREMIKNVDRQVFRRTAVRTKEINIQPYPYRGGTRL